MESVTATRNLAKIRSNIRKIKDDVLDLSLELSSANYYSPFEAFGIKSLAHSTSFHAKVEAQKEGDCNEASVMRNPLVHSRRNYLGSSQKPNSRTKQAPRRSEGWTDTRKLNDLAPNRGVVGTYPIVSKVRGPSPKLNSSLSFPFPQSLVRTGSPKLVVCRKKLSHLHIPRWQEPQIFSKFRPQKPVADKQMKANGIPAVGRCTMSKAARCKEFESGHPRASCAYYGQGKLRRSLERSAGHYFPKRDQPNLHEVPKNKSLASFTKVTRATKLLPQCGSAEAGLKHEWSVANKQQCSLIETDNASALYRRPQGERNGESLHISWKDAMQADKSKTSKKPTPQVTPNSGQLALLKRGRDKGGTECARMESFVLQATTPPETMTAKKAEFQCTDVKARKRYQLESKESAKNKQRSCNSSDHAARENDSTPSIATDSPKSDHTLKSSEACSSSGATKELESTSQHLLFCSHCTCGEISTTALDKANLLKGFASAGLMENFEALGRSPSSNISGSMARVYDECKANNSDAPNQPCKARATQRLRHDRISHTTESTAVPSGYHSTENSELIQKRSGNEASSSKLNGRQPQADSPDSHRTLPGEASLAVLSESTSNGEVVSRGKTELLHNTSSREPSNLEVADTCSSTGSLSSGEVVYRMLPLPADQFNGARQFCAVPFIAIPSK